MKIKTITCHDVYNAGASLQAYALMQYLEDLGNDVEIIDYKPDYLSKHYKIFGNINPRYEKNILLKSAYLVAKLPRRILNLQRKFMFDAFKNNFFRITPKKYCSNDELKNNCPVADVYLAGSDQIWNPIFENGKDPAFYLDFVPDEKIKASYAASFAVNSFSAELIGVTTKRLKRFDYISVRESTGLDILKEMDINNGVQVVDPVFLLSSKSWHNMITGRLYNKKYIFVYDFDKSLLVEKIALYLKSMHDYKIISIQKLHYSDKIFNNAGPLEFLNLVANSEIVISNSFHATAFSLIFHKNFIVTNRQEKINTRMKDLLADVGALQCLFSEFNPSKFEEPKIDWDNVDKELDEKISFSKNYLDCVISGENYD
ncbi:hypothetical protein AGMMS50284_0070 [Clostridia bacterium]|nr:hypothetical protein AGMMS50284_0070 [Clostridia bacterium]